MEEEKKQQTEYEEPVQEETAEEEKNHEGVPRLSVATSPIIFPLTMTDDVVFKSPKIHPFAFTWSAPSILPVITMLLLMTVPAS
mgnify:CR=1 FL=1